ncbi:MAG: cysteine hydrolase [Lachnospiraceae bacterium]|nr:cysteine hydrolase [Lachnospiraceae bacterium]
MKILIVVDMQNDFIDGALGTAEAVEIVPAVIAKIKSYDGLVIATRDTHQENYLSTQEGRNLPVKHCIENTFGWKIREEIYKALKEKNAEIFNKITFGSRELALYLADKAKQDAIEEIELIGLCTDICVISNAMLIKAFLPEVKIKVDAACCAGVTVESHNNALSAMKMCQIEVEE